MIAAILAILISAASAQAAYPLVHLAQRTEDQNRRLVAAAAQRLDEAFQRGKRRAQPSTVPERDTRVRFKARRR